MLRTTLVQTGKCYTILPHEPNPSIGVCATEMLWPTRFATGPKNGLRTSHDYVPTGSPIYSAEWSPDCESVIFTSGKTIVIKPLQSGLKPLKWPAHEGLVLCVAWSPAKNFIVSGGEDRKYKVLHVWC